MQIWCLNRRAFIFLNVMNINLNIALHGYVAGESQIYRAGWQAGEPGTPLQSWVW